MMFFDYVKETAEVASGTAVTVTTQLGHIRGFPPAHQPRTYVELWYKIHVEKKRKKKAERLFPH
jgi:hypothetical protein